jgi:hypothetical protein
MFFLTFDPASISFYLGGLNVRLISLFEVIAPNHDGSEIRGGKKKREYGSSMNFESRN